MRCASFGALLNLRFTLPFALAACAATSATSPAQELDEPPSVAAAIRSSAPLEADLGTLCDRIGPRMAGTAGMRAALDWAELGFARIGLSGVRREAVPMPVRWEEGRTLVEVLSPVSFTVRAASSALSPPVRDYVTGLLADGGTGRPGDLLRRKAALRGRVALVELDEATTFHRQAIEQRDAMVALREAADAGALAVLFLSTRPHRLLYRHVNNLAGGLDPLPSALVAREDGLRMLRLLRAGEPVRVGLELRNQIGPAYETANVVAELRGTAAPEEVVLLGAHLDSWDLGAGCLDNAVNAAMVMHVARSLFTSGCRPRRTVRFVLFGGEEFGLHGSRAYARRHAARLAEHVAVIVHDMGAGRLTGYSTGGREDLLPGLQAALAPSASPQGLRHDAETGIISDHFPFLLEGVPALIGVQDLSDFGWTYHSESDTLDKVRLSDLLQSAEMAAALVTSIADSGERFGEHWGPERVLRWLKHRRLDDHLRFLGVWDSWRPGAGDGRDGG